MGTIRDEIAKNMLFYRKKSGLTQKELADKLGVKNTAVSNWESGNNSVDIETLFLATKIFGVSLSDMYGQYAPPQAPALELNTKEMELVSCYREMNAEGQTAALAAVRGLAAQPIYKKEPDNSSELLVTRA